ncbi:MAG: hypothetical protein QXD98_03420, partial [Candidatus Diapherotrites archaeon]
DTAPTCTKLIPESDYTYTCNWFATTGQHLIKVVATDNAGYSKDATKPVFIYDIPEATLVDTTGDLVGVTNLSSDGTFDYHWQLNFDLITPKKINEISFALKDNLGNYVTYHTDPDLGKVIGIGDGLGNWLPKSHTYSVGSNTIHIYANIHPTCTIEMVPFTIVFDDMSVVLVGIGGA